MTSPAVKLKTPPAYRVPPRCRQLNDGNDSVVRTNIDSSLRDTADLQVDIVPSSVRHSQFSIIVHHAVCKMAERGTDRPVFDH